MHSYVADDIPIPDISHLIIEDGLPVDNFQSEKQQRLLVDPLYSAQPIAQPFIAAANVGLFYGLKLDPVVPDAFLSLGVSMPSDWSQKQNRSYFVWEFGKVPEVCIEVVSNRDGNELDSKRDIYARIGVSYYAVFDPLKRLQGKDELNGSLLKVWALTVGHYSELPQPYWLESVGLGLTLWEGTFEEQPGIWLRWCNRQGQVIPTGAERANWAEQRASQAEGRASQAEGRASQAEEKANRLAARLRELGIDPDSL